MKDQQAEDQEIDEPGRRPRWVGLITKFVSRVGLLLCVLLLGVGWMFSNVDSPPLDLTLLRQLRVGMSRTQVREILGGPSTDERTIWTYSRPLSWPQVHVYFDKDGKVSSWLYDH